MEQLVDIQPLQAGHAQAVTEIHLVSQEGTFLTSLGADFLIILYRQMSQSNYNISYVAIHNNKVVGFVAGALQTKTVFKEVITKQFFRLGWLVFKRALSQPVLLRYALKTLTYPQKSTVVTSESELLALALQPGWRNKGIGKQLLQQFQEAMVIAGVDQIAVTVDGDNDGALRFYRRYGFEPVLNFEMYGRPMVNLVLNLR